MKATKRTKREKELIEAGFVRNPNETIFGLPGTGWYAGGPNILSVKSTDEIRAVGNKIEIYRYYTHPEKAGTSGFLEHKLIVRFSNIKDLQIWCKTNGMLSLGGQAAIYH